MGVAPVLKKKKKKKKKKKTLRNACVLCFSVVEMVLKCYLLHRLRKTRLKIGIPIPYTVNMDF